MKKIIALQGKANCGKTQTLNKLRNKLGKLITSPEDFHDTLSLHHMSDGTRIGIYLDGDDAKCIKDALEKFERENCDVVFCACRTKGDTVNEILNYKNEVLEIQLIGKSIICKPSGDKPREEKCNEADCLRLLANAEVNWM